MLAVDMVRRGAQRYRDRTALVVGERELSFRDVDVMANRIANVLLGLGCGRGTRVGLLVNNGLWSVPLDFGCLKAGVARVPLNARLSVSEHAKMLADTEVGLLVHDGDLSERALALADELDGLRLACLGPADRAQDIDLTAECERADATDPLVPLAPEDVMLLLYTSGTTGTLKAVQHTQASYAAIATNILANLISPGRDDAMLHAASLMHASGTFLLPYWMRGARSVVLPGFEPQSYVQAIEHHRVTAVNLVPTMLGMLLSGDALDGADTSSLDTIIYGASPMPRPMLEQGLERFGPKFVQYYGQTEAPLCQTVLDKADHAEGGALLSSCGHPAVDAEIRIADEDDHPVPPGEIGEIQVRAPFTMAGYHNAPERNHETMAADGWIRTRDMARADERGYLYLVDRASDMIVTGGYNVYPREVEDALGAHPAVAECAVVSAPDATWVEAVTAFTAFRPGESASTEELQATVRERLAGYKVPKRIHVVESIPKSPVGKILRRALRDPLWTDDAGEHR
ncbi:acyl-CoA synthetase (AMP-forming)/AMP-acid ligase II [Halopolyspora algeriensis]|uniref:Acyl-CoA synthetase (AMP-forming)/AMP-acid ligase II n=1 Tax=Halopolyspora algeriensis TaxID=1500506 RepID=A0A368VH95_9ACTN|nr:AMP-binding protein [Halopolyspora algeriensis]RCW39690.1 acyl-CoA synthetase (AMP-forming)/AMP-acid ligase II [Halopolyspora algeriensis]TQM54017.1 acyl-CoA synthetase (AMP-forming)/AMP-acid ligase II [Halopolyspora algeriensis]